MAMASKVLLMILVFAALLFGLHGFGQVWNECHVPGTGYHYAVFFTLLGFSFIGTFTIIIGIAGLE